MLKILNSIILTTLSTIAVWRGVSHCQRMVKRMVISYCRAAHTDKHRKRSTTVARFLRQHKFTLHSMHVAILARVSFFDDICDHGFETSTQIKAGPLVKRPNDERREVWIHRRWTAAVGIASSRKSMLKSGDLFEAKSY